MKPCSFTSVALSLRTPSAYCGTTRSLTFTCSTCASVLHDTTPFTSGSGLRASGETGAPSWGWFGWLGGPWPMAAAGNAAIASARMSRFIVCSWRVGRRADRVPNRDR